MSVVMFGVGPDGRTCHCPRGGSCPTPGAHPKPYASFATQHVAAGVSPVPVRPGCKAPIEPGYTGHDAPMASGADVAAFVEVKPGHNIGDRLPPGTVAIDVDDYDGKVGAATLAVLVVELGALPPAPFVTSRGADSPSRKLLFRTDLGDEPLVGGLGGDVDVLSHGYRYILGPGSLHPDGSTVRAFYADGTPLPDGHLPPVSSWPELPGAWQRRLLKRTTTTAPVQAVGATEPGVLPWEAEDVADEHRAPYRDAHQVEGQRQLAEALEVLDTVDDLAEGERTAEGWSWEHPHVVGMAMRVHELALADWFVDDVGVAVSARDLAPEFLAYLRQKPAHAVPRPAPLTYGPTADAFDDRRAWMPGTAAGAGLEPPAHLQKPLRRNDEDEKPSQSTLLVQMATERYTFGRTNEGEPFALPKSGPRLPRMLRGTDSLRSELARVYYVRCDSTPSSGALTDALNVLQGMAEQSDPTTVHLRVARAGDVLWLDQGDLSGRAVRLDRSGWSLEPSSPVLFRRTALTSALPEPARGGSLAPLWEFVNVADEDKAVVASVLVAALLPDIAHPVVLAVGEQGRGKSRACRSLASVLDPSPVPLRKPPRDLESWTIAAAGSWFVAIDNLSHLSSWLSDSLCRAATGDGDVRRKLYTDDGLHVFAFRRCVIVNGIDVTGVRDDLADRAVGVELLPLTGRRREDSDLDRAWAAAHPLILGGLLDLAARVLDLMPTIKLEDPPRMIDFARVLATVDVLLGTRGSDRYRALAGNLAAESVAGDEVTAAILVDVRGTWEGTASQLLRLLDGRWEGLGTSTRPRDWPRSGRAMTSVLRRRAPALRQLGWEVTDLGRGGRDKSLRWRLVAPAEGGSS